MPKPNIPESNKLPPTNEFHIEFNSAGKSGYLKGVKITIEEDVIDPDATYRIDLADHPLYKSLQKYVKANPR